MSELRGSVSPPQLQGGAADAAVAQLARASVALRLRPSKTQPPREQCSIHSGPPGSLLRMLLPWHAIMQAVLAADDSDSN